MTDIYRVRIDSEKIKLSNYDRPTHISIYGNVQRWIVSLPAVISKMTKTNGKVPLSMLPPLVNLTMIPLCPNCREISTSCRHVVILFFSRSSCVPIQIIRLPFVRVSQPHINAIDMDE